MQTECTWLDTPFERAWPSPRSAQLCAFYTSFSIHRAAREALPIASLARRRLGPTFMRIAQTIRLHPMIVRRVQVGYTRGTLVKGFNSRPALSLQKTVKKGHPQSLAWSLTR
jgi:hypothetical protein